MKTKVIFAFHILLVVAAAWGLGFSVARGQEGTLPAPQAPQAATTAFTYQGSLKKSGSAVNGNCDFQFGLWNAQSLGTQLGVTQTLTSTVSGGLFSVKLNGSSQFGATPFDGSPRWLATAVRCPAGSGSYTSLTHQELNAAPYALSVPWGGIIGRPSNTLVVAKSGGDFNTITAALSSISDASEGNRYLVKVMPGVYTETVAMKHYVDIEGSGELSTRITYTGSANEDAGTLVGASNAEVRFLTVENTGGNNQAIAILSYGTSLRLTHVTATARGGTSNVGVEYVYSSPTMTSVSASGSGGTFSYGVVNKWTSSVIRDSVLSASGGTYNIGLHNSSDSYTYTVTVRNSQVTGSTNTIFNDSEYTTLVAATLLDGGAVSNTGTLTCAGVYDEAYVIYASTCP